MKFPLDIEYYNVTDNPYYLEFCDSLDEKYFFGIDDNVSDDFKKLFIRMFDPSPETRISLEEILESKWLKDSAE